jgi:hypothetical protein
VGIPPVKELPPFDVHASHEKLLKMHADIHADPVKDHKFVAPFDTLGLLQLGAVFENVKNAIEYLSVTQSVHA